MEISPEQCSDVKTTILTVSVSSLLPILLNCLFETRLKYGWFYLQLLSMFQDLSRRSIETGFHADLRRGLNSLNADFC